MTQQTPTSSTPPEAVVDNQTLMEHLNELRNRLTKALIGVLAGMVVGLFLVYGPVQLVDIIIEAFAPINPEYRPVQSVGTTETFVSYMTVALAVGVVLGMPMIVYQLLSFVLPGLHDHEKRLIYRSLPMILLFFVAGLAFGWFVTVPAAISFLIGFSESPWIEVQPSLADFLRIVTTLLLINGVVFEMPVIIYVLALLGVTSAQQLSSYRRYAIVVVVIIAAIITPTGDPINLALLALPMYLLFELGVVMARFVPKRSSD